MSSFLDRSKMTTPLLLNRRTDNIKTLCCNEYTHGKNLVVGSPRGVGVGRLTGSDYEGNHSAGLRSLSCKE